MRISDWSSDVCSSDLAVVIAITTAVVPALVAGTQYPMDEPYGIHTSLSPPPAVTPARARVARLAGMPISKWATKWLGSRPVRFAFRWRGGTGRARFRSAARCHAPGTGAALRGWRPRP